MEFGLLRARILSAGVLFAIFFAIGLIAAAKVFGLFSNQASNPPPPAVGAIAVRRRVSRWLNFVLTAMGFSFVMRSALEGFMDPKGVAWIVVIVVSMGLASWVSGLLGHRRPKVSSAFGIVAILLALFFLYRVEDLGLAVVFLWFVWIALMGHFIDPIVRDPNKVRNLNWEVWVACSVGTVSLFALFLYPHMRSYMGGGVPVPITIQFSGMSPIDGSTRSHLWLIDETEFGFYVVTSKEQRKAVLLTRRATSRSTPTTRKTTC